MANLSATITADQMEMGAFQLPEVIVKKVFKLVRVETSGETSEPKKSKENDKNAHEDKISSDNSEPSYMRNLEDVANILQKLPPQIALSWASNLLQITKMIGVSQQQQNRQKVNVIVLGNDEQNTITRKDNNDDTTVTADSASGMSQFNDSIGKVSFCLY